MKASSLKAMIADIPDYEDLVIEFCSEMSTGDRNIGLGSPRLEIKEKRVLKGPEDREEVAFQSSRTFRLMLFPVKYPA